MDYYSYPLDTKTLLRKKLAIKRELLSQDIHWIEKNVAVLGGSTTNEVVDQLELVLLYYGIKAQFYQSEYGRYYEDAVFGCKELDAFKPDIVYIHTNWRNIQTFPAITDSVYTVNQMLMDEYKKYSSIWNSLIQKYGCVIIQNNFDRPDYRLLGNRDIWDYRGRSNYIARLNQKIYEYVQNHNSIYVNDIDYLAQDYGLSEWNSSLYWNMYKYACPLNAIPNIAFSVGNIIKSIYGKNKKLIALDLDNTIWGGVVGDDGVEGIKIGSEMPQGRVYYEFQKYCKELQKIGVVLAVNSKNEEENALAGLNHPDGLLKKEDFVSVKANWKQKDFNLREMAEDLSLGLDSFVFVDDNPAEREMVSHNLPGVSVPVMEGAGNYIKVLDHSGYFEVTSLSAEDLNKTSQYHARAEAKITQDAYKDYDEFLKSLQMKAVITEFEPISTQRIAQLTNKSNQFNLTTLRCKEEDIRRMQNNPNYICLCGRLIDKFADQGIVTVIAGEIIAEELHIRLWLMSCRVLKRGLEYLMMNTLVSRAVSQGIKKIIGYYHPTSKNGMVRDFYNEMGFALESEDSEGNTTWILDSGQYAEHPTGIQISD